MRQIKTNGPHTEGIILVCSICIKNVKSSGCELLEGTVLEVLEVVLIKLNFITTLPVICKDCYRKLLDAFEHKSKWIYTEDRLYPYVSSAICGKVDMKTVYLNENDFKLFDIETYMQICRFCMELINDKSWNMLLDVLEKQYSLEIFKQYVPELDLNAIENPIICKKCLDSLSAFMGFIAFYQGQNVKTEEYFEVDEELKPDSISPALIEDLKQNEMEYSSEVHIETKSDLIKHEIGHQSVLIDEQPVATKIFKCSICSYATKRRGYLQRHFVIHIPTSSNNKNKMEMFKCEFCEFETKYRKSIRRHVLIHKPVSMVKVFKCEFCSFETIHENSLPRHILVHKPLTEPKSFKCEFCSFVSVDKRTFGDHVLTHKPQSMLKVFQCEFCSYVTYNRRNLRHHLLIHKPLSSVEVFKCEFCSYETNRPEYLRRHIVIHKPLSNVKVYKCDLCSYVTRHKTTLTRHVLIHQPFSDVELHKCEICSFETKHISSFRRHILIHKPLEVEHIKCEP